LSLAVLSSVRAASQMLMDMAFPPRCASCHGAVEAEGNFCADCFAKLRMISAPLCACCGIPFVVAIEDDMQCPACLEAPPAFTKARAAMVYDAVSAPLVSALKFADQWAGLKRHGKMMAGAGSTVLKGADALVPVPLHWRRLLRRRFNQSALLAYAIAAETSLPCAPELLQRIRHTTPQMKLTRRERLTNVAKAFAVPPAAAAKIKDKVIVLVDDVVTTGATAEACAKALLKAGAKEVRVLALARTVKE
jgi:ComF family protein